MRRRRRPTAARPEMNVTPLVDVVLVLLIIFMVVAPRLEQDVHVDLPGVFNPDPATEQGPEPLQVTVESGGTYYANGQPYDLDALLAFLSEAHAADPLRRLVVRADAALTYGQLRALLTRAQKSGFPGVALSVGEKHRQDRQDDEPHGETAG
jgi:biopolymer transport protein TolR